MVNESKPSTAYPSSVHVVTSTYLLLIRQPTSLSLGGSLRRVARSDPTRSMTTELAGRM